MESTLIFTGAAMRACVWARGRLLLQREFLPEEAGFAAFRGFLSQSPRQPVRLLVDLVEEGFRLEQVPNVHGSDRRALLRRLLARHFRTTELRHASVQERRRSGRRDRMVLVSGLTNPESLGPWLEILVEAQVPLRGIYSLPLLGERLLARLGLCQGAVLLVSRHSPHNLRQSYYTDGRLKLSRLVPLSPQPAADFAALIEPEVASTLRFLEAQRLRRRNEEIRLVVLAPAQGHDRLGRLFADDGTIRLLLHDPAALAGRLGMAAAEEARGAGAELLFAHLLASSRAQPNHYASHRLRRYFYHRAARSLLHWTSAAIALGAAAAAFGAYLDASAMTRIATETARTAQRYQSLYERSQAQTDGYAVEAAYVKDTVDLAGVLARRIAASRPSLPRAIGAILDGFPRIAVDGLTWGVTEDRDFVPDETNRDRHGAAADRLSEASYYQNGLLRGRVEDFGSDYRGAVDYFHAFRAALQASGRFIAVEVRRPPYDIDPARTLTGDSGLAARSPSVAAEFALALRMEAPDARD